MHSAPRTTWLFCKACSILLLILCVPEQVGNWEDGIAGKCRVIISVPCEWETEQQVNSLAGVS